ncbi:chromosome segregation ATPase [Rhodobacteraceae bacterium MBR-64]
MSRWSEQFANHPIHETLRQLREWVFIDIEDIDSDHEAEQRRLLKAIDTIKAVVEGLDPELFPEAELTQLNNHLRDQNFWNQLNSYSSDGNVGQLKSANDHITSQIHGIFKMAMLAKPPELQRALTVIEEAYDGFCKAIEEAKAGFEQKCAEYAANVAEFDQRITALQQDFDALKQSTEASLAGWQTEFTNAETTRAQEHSDSQLDFVRYAAKHSASAMRTRRSGGISCCSRLGGECWKTSPTHRARRTPPMASVKVRLVLRYQAAA